MKLAPVRVFSCKHPLSKTTTLHVRHPVLHILLAIVARLRYFTRPLYVACEMSNFKKLHLTHTIFQNLTRVFTILVKFDIRFLGRP